MRFRVIITALLALVVVLGALYVRWRPRAAAEVVEREQETVLPPEPPPGPLSPPPPPAAPALSEVQPLLDRVFDQTLAVDEETRPAFVAGDFNGDDITDLAVAVRPRSEAALGKLNAELASWGRQDATAPPSPDASSKPAQVRVAAEDLLLVVVHGVAEAGWRSPDTQGYLVKNAVGSGMRSLPLTSMPAALRMEVIRSHTGDVIAGDRGGKPGLLFWAGGAYVWADRFDGAVHGR
jgi:hypothetical protein